MPEAYTKRTRRMTEKRAKLLPEDLFNTLLLSNCLKKAQHKRDKHKSPKTPTETPLNPPKGSPNLKSTEFIPFMFPILKELCKSEERREPRHTPGSRGTNEDLPADVAMCETQREMHQGAQQHNHLFNVSNHSDILFFMKQIQFLTNGT